MIEVYTKDACMSCDMTKKYLRRNNLNFSERPVTDLQDQNYLGYQQAPIVIAGENHWSGFRPDLIKTLI